MEMKRILYDFCPKCSGLMKDGICMACGYGNPEVMQTDAGEGAAPSDSPTSDELQAPKKKKHTGVIIGLLVSAVLFVLILSVALYLIVSDMKRQSAKTWNPLNDAVSEEKAAIDGADKGDTLRPSDEYYVEIVDALRAIEAAAR